jgi:hypothetical protein
MNDPFNEFGIFFIVFFIVCVFLGLFVYYPFKLIVNDYLTNDNVHIVKAIKFLLNLFGVQFPSHTYILFLLFLILYLILYGFFLIIMFVIPKTGWETLFIPIRELLLKIPPLPLLIEKKVFYIFELFFGLFSGYINFNDFFNDYFSFTKDNIIQMIRIFNPSLDSMLDKIDNFNNKGDNKEVGINDDDKTNVDVCVNSQAPLTTPDMNFIDLVINEIKNTKNNIKCNLNSIKYYVKSSANDASMNATDKINHMND